MTAIDSDEDTIPPARLKIGRLMKERGMTVQQLKNLTGLAYNTVLSYSRNSSDRLSKDALGKIAAALGLNVSDLFDN